MASLTRAGRWIGEWRGLATALLVSASGASAHAQGGPCPRRALLPFLALQGAWSVAWEARFNDTLQTATGAAAVVERAAGDCGISERLSGEFRGQRFAVTTTIAAPADDSLQLAYLDSGHGGLLLFSGRQRGSVIEFTWQHDWGDHVQLVRREYTNLTRTSFVAETYMSPNGGAEWRLVQRARYSRRS